ncbi:MAG: ubiquinol-cytochrome c reductase cytochrome b subunit [Frankiaceae bacterium]|nr:ubiquinol-cytochrome c reductase cytochrome b subunit [Frankiaceae bacterium]
MTTTAPRRSKPTTMTGKAVGGVGRWADDRFGGASFLRRTFNKVFPDHWSFMLGEIALYSFIILLLTGVFLTFFFDPSIKEVVYNGSYEPLKGVKMTQAFASTLNISFDVRGGLLIRQIHHWAALIFVASMSVHLLRVFFTGAFRKPREMNWVIGALLLQISLLEGFAGYSLPDDLLSGTGLRIGFSIVESIPVIGTYFGFFVFGGNYPGPQFIPRLFTIHILLIPGILLLLISAHMMLLWHQKHTQFPGPGKTETNVVGHRFYPVFMAKGGAFFLLVFAVLAFLGAAFQINPIWLYGPYNPAQVSAGSQPDWYIGWLDGSIRLMPPIETNIAGHTISWNLLVPGLVLPGVIFGLLTMYPFLEAWATGDKRYHNLLDRPRNRPVRTGLGVMSLVFYFILWLAGGNDIFAHVFHLSINTLTWIFRVGVIVAPPIAFVITKRLCIGLQRKDAALAEHGHETGIIKRLPSGEYIEVHEPIDAGLREFIGARAEGEGGPKPITRGKRPGGPLVAAQRKLGGFYGDGAPAPLPEAHHNGHGEHHPEELETPVD